MAQEGRTKTIEDIQAEFLEIPTDNGPNAESKDLAAKILQNNFKLCLFAEHFEQEAKETKNRNQTDPKIELLKKGQAAVAVLKQLFEKTKAENSGLREELLDLKQKRKEKRFFDKNRESYIEYREKIFPILMQDCEKKEELIDELNKNVCGNNSDKDLKQITKELEKVTKENERLKKTEEEIIEIRRKNEVIEVETCRIQVHNIEMENEIRLFDEFVLENQIFVLQQKIRDAKEEKYKQEEEKMSKEEFKNPNDFPTLLDFLDKSKKLKHKKKRKLTSPSRPPSKRRKNKTGSYSQHDKNGKLQSNNHSQAKSSSQGISPKHNNRGSKNVEVEKVRVMESVGLKKKADNRANLSAQTSNDQGSMLQRTFASTNLAKVNSPRPPLQRQKSIIQMEPKSNTTVMSIKAQQMSKGRNQSSINSKVPMFEPSKTYEPPQEYQTDEDGHLLLQRFPSRPLFPEEPKMCRPSRQIHPKSVQSNVPANRPEKPTKIVETPAKERMETDMTTADASVTKQPSTERGLRSRKKLRSQKISPKKAEKNDKKEIDRKKVKSPKKEVKKGSSKKKVGNSCENEMIIDGDNASAESNTNQVIVDDITMTSGDNADKSMAVDENPIVESSGNSSSNAESSNTNSITESIENTVMDVDQNVQEQEVDKNLPEIFQIRLKRSIWNKKVQEMIKI
ncbi:uncharacterized protein [Chironomus tepperi]|uniref:uncharacterized protein n=1 Tax=Chironomus tepperi TaxID=113505 RepID=UPI00391F3A71